MAREEEMVQAVLRRHKQLQKRKSTWLQHYQLLGEFLHTRKQEFTSEHENGEFLNRELFDSVGPKALKTASSSLIAMLWPQSIKRFRFNPPQRLSGRNQTREIKEYYEAVTRKVVRVMDNPKARLATALDEYMLDNLAFGTAGIQIDRDEETLVSYRPWGVKHMSIAQGKKGDVDTVYLELKMPVHELVKEYGKENVSEKVIKAFNEGKFEEEHAIIIAIEPRIMGTTAKFGNQAMPWQSVHIDKKEKKLMRDTGFEEMPIKVNRFTKIQGEVYGRSPGMDALPDILESNAVWEATMLAMEKSLDPPLGVIDDSVLGNAEIDTSAGALNVFKLTGRAGEANPIFPLFTVGETRHGRELIEILTQSITDHFFIDRLLDFNNETRMTLGEAQIRDRNRNSSLQSVFARKITEVFSPLIERTFNVLMADDQLGVPSNEADEFSEMVIPDDVLDLIIAGEDVFEIEYFTPAMKIMQAEEAEGILRSWEAAGLMAQLRPDVVDVLDADESLKRFTGISGAPSEIIKADKTVKDMREARDQAAQEQAQLEQAQMATDAMRNAGQSGLLPTQAPKQPA